MEWKVSTNVIEGPGIDTRGMERIAAREQDAGGSSSAVLRLLTSESFWSGMVGMTISVLLYVGWMGRETHAINPEDGVGYWLGIGGGSMMLLLLVYPFRKRIRFLNKIGSIGFWFRFHMLLGMLGPVAILYHARFAWGALNSAVAMDSMLIVAASGLVGRFFYARVHRGYSGRKLEVRALLTDLHSKLDEMTGLAGDVALVSARLKPFEASAVAAGASFWTSAASVFNLGWTTRRERWRLVRDLKGAVAPQDGSRLHSKAVRRKLIRLADDYFHAVRRAGEFAFYDRMLRLWHMLHLPLFFILIATAILHIVAVHMY
jgi:hypothetical protein